MVSKFSCSDIIERPVSSDIMAKAHQKSLEMGTLRNSVTKGSGNLTGFVGEGLVYEYLLDNGNMIEWSNTYDYDLIMNGDILIDVKSKKTGFQPKLHYECSIADQNTKQACDIYFFTRVRGDMTSGWLLGWLPKKEYFDKATFIEKGEVDKTNGWKCKTDCWNVAINELRSVNELVQL